MSFRETWRARIREALTDTPTATSAIAAATAIPPKDAYQILVRLRGERAAVNGPRLGPHRRHPHLDAGAAHMTHVSPEADGGGASPGRPLLRYLGGKARLAPKIVPSLPPHAIYVEPFGGSAAVLAAKPRVRQEIWNDLDGEVVNLFQVLRSGAAAALLRAIELTPYARAEHELAYAATDDPVERARRLLVRSHMGHGTNGTQINLRNGFRIDGCVGKTNVAGEWAAFPRQLELWIQRMRGVQLEQRPAPEIIDRYNAAGVLLYVDPPYLPETRSQSVRWTTGKCAYAHELSVDEHVALLGQLARSEAMVVVSGYPSALYDEALRGWRRVPTATALALRSSGSTPPPRPRTGCSRHDDRTPLSAPVLQRAVLPALVDALPRGMVVRGALATCPSGAEAAAHAAYPTLAQARGRERRLTSSPGRLPALGGWRVAPDEARRHRAGSRPMTNAPVPVAGRIEKIWYGRYSGRWLVLVSHLGGRECGSAATEAEAILRGEALIAEAREPLTAVQARAR